MFTVLTNYWHRGSGWQNHEPRPLGYCLWHEGCWVERSGGLGRRGWGLSLLGHRGWGWGHFWGWGRILGNIWTNFLLLLILPTKNINSACKLCHSSKYVYIIYWDMNKFDFDIHVWEYITLVSDKFKLFLLINHIECFSVHSVYSTFKLKFQPIELNTLESFSNICTNLKGSKITSQNTWVKPTI